MNDESLLYNVFESRRSWFRSPRFITSAKILDLHFRDTVLSASKYLAKENKNLKE